MEEVWPQWSTSIPPGGASLGFPLDGLGEGVGDCRGAVVTPKGVLCGSLGDILGGEETLSFLGEHGFVV